MTPYRHKVQYYETDKMGVTHHANYIRWMEEARVDLLERMGWGYDRMEALGIQSPVTEVACTYRSPTTFGDTVEIWASIREYRGVHLVMAYEMRRLRDGKVVLEGTSRHCFLDGAGKFLRLARDFPELDRALRAEMEERQQEGANWDTRKPIGSI